jgi:hypothetical protein
MEKKMQGRFSPPCEIFISSTTSLVLRDLTPTFDKEPLSILVGEIYQR